MAAKAYLNFIRRISVRTAFASLWRAMKGAPSCTDQARDTAYSRFVYPILVNSLYKTAFGRLADEAGLAGNVARLQAGTPLEALAEDLVRSDEFQAHHGSDPGVNSDYLTALYHNGL